MRTDSGAPKGCLSSWSTVTRFIFLLFPLFGATGGAVAQTIVVDPNGSGQFTSLQAALDTAPSGATIRVVGGMYGPITINRSVTIFGDPAPLIGSAPCGRCTRPLRQP